jgi:hypothetical protein
MFCYNFLGKLLTKSCGCVKHLDNNKNKKQMFEHEHERFPREYFGESNLFNVLYRI